MSFLNTYENVKTVTIDTTRRDYKELLTLNTEEKIDIGKYGLKTSADIKENNSTLNIKRKISFITKKNVIFNQKNNKKKDVSNIFNKKINHSPIKTNKHCRVTSLPNLDRTIKSSLIRIEEHNNKQIKSKQNLLTSTLNRKINQSINKEIKETKGILKIQLKSSLSMLKTYKTSKTPENKKKSPSKKQSIEKSKFISPSKRDLNLKIKSGKPYFKIYLGPIDLSCCFILDPETLIRKLTLFLKKSKIIFYTSFKKLYCSKNEIKFCLDVQVINYSTMSYLKIKKMQGCIFEYNLLISKLIKELRI